MLVRLSKIKFSRINGFLYLSMDTDDRTFNRLVQKLSTEFDWKILMEKASKFSYRFFF